MNRGIEDVEVEKSRGKNQVGLLGLLEGTKQTILVLIKTMLDNAHDCKQHNTDGNRKMISTRRKPPEKCLALLIGSFLIFATILSVARADAARWQEQQSFDDNDILEAIEVEFRADDSLSADTLDVRVNEGIVTLEGEVKTMLAKRQAVKATGSLKGVRGIIDKIQVLPTSRTTDEIAKDVNAALDSDEAVGGDSISVSVESSGKVVLTGNTDSYVELILAESVVAGVRGVTDIDNQMEVKSESSRPADEIKAEIQRRFELSPFLAEGLIEVEVDGQNVVLSGTVGSVNEKELARVLCWSTGIAKVDISQLHVDSSQDQKRRRDKFTTIRSDLDLQKAVEDSLLYDPRVRNAQIGVRTNLGAVTLSGNVNSLASKRAAEDDALNTLGVRRVINNLKVKIADWPGDLKLTEQAEAVIARDAELADTKLQVSSHFGKMYVSGQVNTFSEKKRVDAVVANMPGVRDVVNRVQVDSQWQEKPDEDIKEDTLRRIEWSPLLNAEDISVNVDDGIVTLQGTVDTWQDRNAAGLHAGQAGALRVKNKLNVRIAGKETKT